MIARKFVYGGVIAVLVASSALAVNAQSNSSNPNPSNTLPTNLNQLAQRFEGLFSDLAQAAKSTPQPTAQPTVQPTAAPTVQPTAVPQSPYIGVQVEDTAEGVIVRSVIDGSPAATAGLKVGDIIQKANDETLKNVIMFAQMILKMKPDATLKLDVMRADKAMSISVKVGGQDPSKAFVIPSAAPYDGFMYNTTDKSWHVFQLSDHSLLYSAGLRTNDQITGFDGKMIAPADFQTYRNGLKADANVKLTVQTAGKSNTITVPGAALQTLNAFSTDNNGLLLDVLPAGKGIGPNLDSLSHTSPVNAIAYDGKNWQIYSLVDGSTLQSSGLQVNDQITAFNGIPYNPDSVRSWLASMNDTASVKLTVERNGKSQEITVPAGNLTDLYLMGDKSGALFFGLPETGVKPDFGVNAVALTDAIAKQHQLKQTAGALVTTIEPNSVAAAAGIKMNDVITAISSQNIDAQHDLNSLLDTFKPGDALTLDIARGDKTMQLKATLPPDVTGELPLLIQPL